MLSADDSSFTPGTSLMFTSAISLSREDGKEVGMPDGWATVGSDGNEIDVSPFTIGFAVELHGFSSKLLGIVA